MPSMLCGFPSGVYDWPAYICLWCLFLGCALASNEVCMYLALINLRILCVTQGRQCLGLICFCGINSCIAFKRVVFKTVHCVFTEVCSVVLCMQLRRVESFDLIPSQLAFRKMNMLR